MRKVSDQNAIGGKAIHVGDCLVWAEIYYLDSPTDYREYITNHVSPRRATSSEEFVTLDDAVQFSWAAVAKFPLVLLTRLFTMTWKSCSATPIA